MKAWATATLACGLALMASTSVSARSLNSNSRNRIAFNTFEVSPLPKSLLAAVNLDEVYGGSPECKITEKERTEGKPKIMIAIDKCLNSSAIQMIHDWINEVDEAKTAFVDAYGKVDLEFVTTLVQGQCAARSEKEKSGREIESKTEYTPELLADGTDFRQFTQVLPGEVERIAAFAKFGRVLTSAEEGKDNTIAVVSFVTTPEAFEYVTQFEQTNHISKTFGFQLCGSGKNCNGKFENCVFLEETVDLYMYNPYTITHSWSCAEIEMSVPVTILDSEGKRKCYCSCPHGTTLQVDDAYGTQRCVVVEPEVCPCVWSDHPFKWDNEDKLDKCVFTEFATKKHLPVPFPTDNYVSDYRTNNQDGTDGKLEDGPHIDVIVTRIGENVYSYDALNSVYGSGHNGEPLPDSLPDVFVDLLNEMGQGDIVEPLKQSAYGAAEAEHYAWKDYQKHRVQKIDNIELTAYGKYGIAVKATDYQGDDYAATCVGCIAVVDKYRPKTDAKCPKSFCDESTSSCRQSPTAEVTDANIEKAQSVVADFYKFGDESYNDACSSKEHRCDDNSFRIKNFFEDDYTDDDFEKGRKCFDKDAINADLAEKIKNWPNPLEGSNCHKQNPVEIHKCQRCCEFSSTLKEWWVDYTCGHDYDVARCEGEEGQTCSTKQCLVVLGDTLATVSACLKPEVAEESAKVIEALDVKGFQTVTQVHRALTCTKFDESDEACSFTASIHDLVDVTVKNNYGSESDNYVYWRYKFEDDHESWHLYDPRANYQTSHKFTEAQTKITLEAWTPCGLARKFYFYVHLHVHSEVKVCELFNSMWYQTSTPREAYKQTDGLCAYPGSDFAELTFDYQPNVGLQYAKNNLRMHVSGVRCELEFPGKKAVEILNVQQDSPEIIERFAVELQELAATAPSTQFSVKCEFTYTKYDGSTVPFPCTRSFEIQDCTGPYVDPPHGECQWEDCAGQDAPGPGEACGGKVVRANEHAAYMDDLTEKEATCCEGCGLAQACESIFDLHDIPNPIKRCVPPTTTDAYGEPEYAYGPESYGTTTYYGQAVQLMSKAVDAHPTAAMASALLAASAMVAVVALVVVRRRRAAQEKQMIEEDAYYPLLH